VKTAQRVREYIVGLGEEFTRASVCKALGLSARSTDPVFADMIDRGRWKRRKTEIPLQGNGTWLQNDSDRAPQDT